MPSSLPPGFQFFPSDEELVVHFLRCKALGQRDFIIPTLDPRHHDPWELDGKALEGGNHWYFFIRRTENRSTACGCWVSEGGDEPVASGGYDVGVKKTFVFFAGEAPDENKTTWIMHEYHLLHSSSPCRKSCSRKSSKKRGRPIMETNKWVICQVYDSSYGSRARFCNDGMELSCLDEAFLSIDDDIDEISWPN